MLRKIIGKAWRITPKRIRARMVRLTQDRFTASAAVVIFNELGEVLLLDHLLRPASGWGLPGGFINRSENPDRAIRREIREEIGIELDELKLRRVRTFFRHIEVVFSAKAVGEPAIGSREILGFGWFTVAEMPNGVSPDHIRLVKEVLADEI